MQFLNIVRARHGSFAIRPGRNCLALVLLLGGIVPTPGLGQWLLIGRNKVAANQVFDATSQHEPLKCRIDKRKPSLDFTLRFDAGYVVTCPFSISEGSDIHIMVLTRVTPEGEKPVLLGAHSIFRGSPARELSPRDARKLKSKFHMSGGFSVGEGRYRVEVLVLDDQNRECRRNWKIEVTHHEQSKSPVVMAAHTVSPLDVPVWQGARAGRDGLRLTVFLEAAPVFRSQSNHMTAWDRVLLLQFLSSLLEQTPCRSVRLVAFSLEQQKEIFRSDSFEPSGIAKLQEVLARLELRTVPVSTLQHPNGWIDMLTRMVNQEVNAPTPSDAVVFLGRSNRWMDKLPPLMAKPDGKGKPRFFAFQYQVPRRCFPPARCADWPDATAFLAKALGGTFYRIYSPRDLGKATRNMVEKVRR